MKYSKQLTLISILVLITTSLTIVMLGCASRRVMKTETGREVKAEVDETKPLPEAREDKSLLIFIRTNEYLASLRVMRIRVDGQLIGELGPSSYVYTYVSPGEHTLESNFSNAPRKQIKKSFQEGRKYYFETYLSMGMWEGEISFHTLSKKEGKVLLKSL